MKEERLVQVRETESIVSDRRSKSVLLVPPLFGNVFQMSATGNEEAPFQSHHGKMHNIIQVRNSSLEALIKRVSSDR